MRRFFYCSTTYFDSVAEKLEDYSIWDYAIIYRNKNDKHPFLLITTNEKLAEGLQEINPQFLYELQEDNTLVSGYLAESKLMTVKGNEMMVMPSKM